MLLTSMCRVLCAGESQRRRCVSRMPRSVSSPSRDVALSGRSRSKSKSRSKSHVHMHVMCACTHTHTHSLSLSHTHTHSLSRSSRDATVTSAIVRTCLPNGRLSLPTAIRRTAHNSTATQSNPCVCARHAHSQRWFHCVCVCVCACVCLCVCVCVSVRL